MDSTMLTLNNNSSKLDKYGYDQGHSSNNSDNSMKSALPSFHDILWCPDVDGDVIDAKTLFNQVLQLAEHLKFLDPMYTTGNWKVLFLE